jgi:hypothetical protein
MSIRENVILGFYSLGVALLFCGIHVAAYVLLPLSLFSRRFSPNRANP